MFLLNNREYLSLINDAVFNYMVATLVVWTTLHTTKIKSYVFKSNVFKTALKNY